MNGLWLVLLILVCPLTMGALMLYMLREMRGEHRGRTASGGESVGTPPSPDQE